jgi:hypothetical protein
VIAYKGNLRVSNCEFGDPERQCKVSQKIYGLNSLEESVWGCIGECPIIECDFNLHPAQEEHRRSVYGRTNIC